MYENFVIISEKTIPIPTSLYYLCVMRTRKQTETCLPLKAAFPCKGNGACVKVVTVVSLSEGKTGASPSLFLPTSPLTLLSRLNCDVHGKPPNNGLAGHFENKE